MWLLLRGFLWVCGGFLIAVWLGCFRRRSWLVGWFWVMVGVCGLELLICGWGGFAILLCLFDLVFCGGRGGLWFLVGLGGLW